MVENVGHFIHRDDFDAFLESLDGWIRPTVDSGPALAARNAPRIRRPAYAPRHPGLRPGPLRGRR